MQCGPLLRRDQLPLLCPTQEVSRFIQRTARRTNKPLVICRRCPAVTFGDIGSNTIGCADELGADRMFCERLPLADDVPNYVRQFLSHRINPQLLES